MTVAQPNLDRGEEGVLNQIGISGSMRLPLRVDAPRLMAEIERLPADSWGLSQRGPVVFAAVNSLYVIGYPRDSRNTSMEDREVLGRLPYLKEVLHRMVPAKPVKAVISRQSGQGLVPIHKDDRKYFSKTVRLSIQIDADGPQRFFSNGLWYELHLGEVWAIDNLNPHGVNNTGGRPRTIVIADYEPSDALLSLITNGERELGVWDEAAQRELEAASAKHYRDRRWQAWVYGVVKRWKRRGNY